jgi:hypothetical protein
VEARTRPVNPVRATVRDPMRVRRKVVLCFPL